MNTRIYGTPEPQPPIYLKLESQAPGTVTVIVVNENGEPRCDGKLVTFLRSGRIYIHAAVSKTFGFQQESSGKIQIEPFDFL